MYANIVEAAYLNKQDTMPTQGDRDITITNQKIHVKYRKKAFLFFKQ